MSFHHSEDRILGGRVRISQPTTGFRSAIDPVLLAAACPAKAGQRVLDVGCGVGTALFCLMKRIEGISGVGLDKQDEMIALARHNAQINELGSASFVAGNLASPPPELIPGSFDLVLSNPPFLTDEDGTPPPDDGKSAAHVESEVDLRRWLGFCVALLRHKGSLVLIHRADRLDDILRALEGRAGEVTILPLWPKEGRPARRVLVKARKGVRTPLSLLPGLVLHEANGSFTAAAEAILRDAQSLNWPSL